MTTDWKTIDTDFLVVGGGVAGCMAAIPALEAGHRVVMCEKGKVLDHCGSVGCGVDHYLTVMESGPEWDTPEFLIRHVPELTDGIVDLEVASRVIHEMPKILRKIESFGVDFRDPGDRRVQPQALLRPSRRLPHQFRRHRVQEADRPAGAPQEGDRPHAHHGGSSSWSRTTAATVRSPSASAPANGSRSAPRPCWWRPATSTASRATPPACAFDSWHCPYNTGDAQAMGYRAGAVLANMEFTEATLTPKGFSAQGLNALVSEGAYFINKAGDRFMFKYDPKGENARRAVITDAVVNEYLLGNGPDLRRPPPPAVRDPRPHGRDPPGRPLHAPRLLRAEAPRLPHRARRSVDLGAHHPPQRRLFPRQWSGRRHQRRDIDRRAFSAGNSATVSGGIAGAAVLGHIAGEGAAARIRASAGGALPDIDMDVAAATRAEAESHVNRRDGMPGGTSKARPATSSPTTSACAGPARA